MSSSHCTNVFIVEDSPSIRDRLVEMLSDVEGVAVIGAAETPADAIAGILRAQPDIVILDYQLDGGTAVDVLKAVRPVLPEIVFVVLTNHSSPQYRRACVEAGARHFLDKSLEFHRVKEIIAGAGSRPLQDPAIQ